MADWKNPGCCGCLYFVPHDQTCDYIGKTGMMRNAKCGEHGGCEKWTSDGSGEKLKVPAAKKKKFFDGRRDEFMELYNQGMSDKAISDSLGCAQCTVTNYRNSLGLKPIYKHETQDRVKELHGQGLSDAEIALVLDRSESTIRGLRRNLGLIPNYRRINNKELSKLFGSGFSDYEISEKTELSLHEIALKRKDWENGKSYHTVNSE